MPDLDAVFFALSDPTRRAILIHLAYGEATVMEIAKPFEMSQPAISRHLSVLEAANLIVRRVDGSRRPCKLATEGMEVAEQWLTMLHAALERSYERLDKILETTEPEKGETP